MAALNARQEEAAKAAKTEAPAPPAGDKVCVCVSHKDLQHLPMHLPRKTCCSSPITPQTTVAVMVNYAFFAMSDTQH